MGLHGLNLYFVNFNIAKATRSQFFACIFEIIEPPKRYKKRKRKQKGNTEWTIQRHKVTLGTQTVC